MNKSKKYLIRRLLGYLFGFVLFYAPISLAQKIIVNVFNIPGSEDIHGACFRMGIGTLFKGPGLNLVTTTGIIVSVVLIAALLIGPVFCGRLCAAGAVSEYLSRIIPKKIQINWQKNIDPMPIRYGVLTGFLILPFWGGSIYCAYCNYSILSKITTWQLGALGSTTILTGFIWLIVLGAFAKGGRGYCSYLCPVGAFQSLIHSFGAKLPFTYKIKFSKEKCVSCNLCVKECPMGALQRVGDNLNYNIHGCITCNQCVHTCPKGAITFGQDESGWILKEEKTKGVEAGGSGI